ncbi:MAG: histidinol phosphate phosphatase [Planctomycetales bacterium]|nr:histidinol phosphate phosphatase [Planctomycetales bacterium]
MTPEITDRLELAIRIAQGAGQIVEDLRKQFQVEKKADSTPVTDADKAAEVYLRAEIEAQFSSDAVIGEEFGQSAGTSGFTWVVDPIDGTKSFIAGVPLYGTLVGVLYEGKPVIGVIELPALDCRVFAASGSGAFQQNGQSERIPARVSNAKSLSEGVYVTSEVKTFQARNALDVHLQLEEKAWYGRTWGDCYGYYLVATGRALAMVDPVMSIWDAAAILPVMEEAGGAFVDWNGNPTVHSGEGIGATKEVLDEVLAVTRPFATKK